jgi:hypothetical protein
LENALAFLKTFEKKGRALCPAKTLAETLLQFWAHRWRDGINHHSDRCGWYLHAMQWGRKKTKKNNIAKFGNVFKIVNPDIIVYKNENYCTATYL